jgi:hypothetical protein
LHTVAPGEVRDCRIDVELVPGRVHVVSAATDEPLIDHAVLLRRSPLEEELPFSSSISVRTDDRGDLSLHLAPGSYLASATRIPSPVPPGRQDRTVRLEWGPGGGTPSVIRLPIAPGDEVPRRVEGDGWR